MNNMNNRRILMDYVKLLKEHPLKAKIRGMLTLDELRDRLKVMFGDDTPSISYLWNVLSDSEKMHPVVKEHEK